MLVKSYIRLIIFLFILIPNYVFSFDCPSVGAIRWDAWSGGNKGGSVEMSVETSLSHEKFRGRAPTCSKILANGKLEINCSTQEVMDREINQAISSGINYWAFVTYPEGNSLNNGLALYLNNNKTNQLKFSLILTPASLSQPQGSLSKNIDKVAKYTVENRYMKVLNGRPLLFFLPEYGFLNNSDKLTWLKSTISKLRSQTKGIGQTDPYIVLMVHNLNIELSFLKEYGFDAISSYAIHGNGQNEPYYNLTKEAIKFWDAAKSKKIPIIPTVMAGWDRRPRVITPMPWEKENRPNEINYFYNKATPSELAEHIGNSIYWVNRNSTIAAANTLIVYAWNEYDEGGWIAPTLVDGDLRLKAIDKKIKEICQQK